MLATWGCTTFPKPTLSLDFLGATSLDSGITFSRGSQATLFDSTGTLRYAKHNLALQSQDFATTWSQTNGSITANAIVAPDGTLTADKFIPNTTAGVHYPSQSVTTNTVSHTASVYLKAGEYSWAILYVAGAGVGYYFDIANGAVGSAFIAAPTSFSIQSVGDGWRRYSITFTATAATTVRIYAATANGTNSFSGDGTSGIFLWGAQINQNPMEGGVTSSLTTYYPTTTAAYYAPRFDYDPSTLQPRGLLIEEQRTNSIRNSTGVGAVAGTPGTLPTNWTTQLSGLTQTVVGAGTSSGISYIDIRLNGTTSANFFTVLFEPSNGIAASNSQTWSASSWIAVVGGSTANITSLALAANQYSSVPTYISTLLGTNRVSTITSSLTRISDALTTNSASTAFIQPLILFNCAVGAAIDITLRIGLPQLELGAFATSVIPTTTTALTRNADVASMTGTNFSSWYSASEGTLLARCSLPANPPVSPAASSFPRIASINDNLDDNSIEMFLDGSSPFYVRSRVRSGAVNQAVGNGTTGLSLNTQFSSALTYKVNDFAAADRGLLSWTDTSGTIPTVNRLGIGNQKSDLYLNGHIQRISFWPTRLPNATLQALTA